MSEEKIQIVATARDQASAQLKGLRGNIAALGTKTGGPIGGMLGGLAGINPAAVGAGLGFGAAMGAAKLLTDALGDGISSALEEQASLKKLDTALQNNVTNWDGNRDAIDDAIEARMGLAFQDDELRDSMAKLLVSTKDEEEALRLNAIAMDVARGRGISLAQATDIVVKANNGNIGALKRLGIAIDKDATAQEALNKLQSTYAGQAGAYAETAIGAAESFGIAIDEIKEDVGSQLIPIMGDAAKTARDDLAPALKDVTDLLLGMTGDQIDMDNGIFDLLSGARDFIPPGALQDAWDNAVGDVNFARAIEKGIGEEDAGLRASGVALTAGVAKGVEAGGPAIRQATINATSGMADAVKDAVKKATESARQLDGDLAGAIRGNKDAVKAAMDEVAWAIKHPMAEVKELARIEGAITTLEYKRGLASNTDEVNTVIDQQKQILIGLWENITGVAYSKGAAAGQAWRSAFKTNSAIGNFNPFKNSNADPGKFNGAGRAAGGPVAAGESYLIGEKGPEILTMGARGGFVTPNSAIGGGPIIVNVDGRELFRIMDTRQGRALATSSNSAYVRG